MQQQRMSGSMKADPVDVRPEASSKGASVSSDRSRIVTRDGISPGQRREMVPEVRTRQVTTNITRQVPVTTPVQVPVTTFQTVSRQVTENVTRQVPVTTTEWVPAPVPSPQVAPALPSKASPQG